MCKIQFVILLSKYMPRYISELLMRHLPEKLIFLSTMIMSFTEGRHSALLYTAMSHSKMGVSIQLYQNHGQCG